MQEIIEMISNYGIGIACVGYLIYFQNTTMKEMIKTMQDMSKSLDIVNDRLQAIEEVLK